MVLCTVAFMTYLGINQILIVQQDRALVERIERLEILLQDSRNIEQFIAQPELYQNMLGNQDNLFVLLKGNQALIKINPLWHLHCLIYPPAPDSFCDLSA